MLVSLQCEHTFLGYSFKRIDCLSFVLEFPSIFLKKPDSEKRYKFVLSWFDIGTFLGSVNKYL